VLVVEYPRELKSGSTDIPPEAAAIAMPEDLCPCWWYIDQHGFKQGPQTFASLKQFYAEVYFKAEDRLVLYDHSDPSPDPWTTFNIESRRRLQMSGMLESPSTSPHMSYTPTAGPPTHVMRWRLHTGSQWQPPPPPLDHFTPPPPASAGEPAASTDEWLLLMRGVSLLDGRQAVAGRSKTLRGLVAERSG